MVCQMMKIPNRGMYIPQKNPVKILKWNWSKLMIWKIWSQHHGKPVSISQNCIFYEIYLYYFTDKKTSKFFVSGSYSNTVTPYVPLWAILLALQAAISRNII